MRLFFLEHTSDYQTYSFAYRPMLELEPGDSTSESFDRGFLPYTADPSDPRHLFYLGRSVRYDLESFSLAKKRRHLFRKVSAVSPVLRVQAKDEALASLPGSWRDEVFRWTANRFGRCYLSLERLNYILSKPFCTHLASVTIDGSAFAYIVLGAGESHFHYWYAFYDTSRLSVYSPGKWLMARMAMWASDWENVRYFYVGTAYSPGSAYKVHGVRGAEFFDGRGWNRDLDALMRCQAAD